MRGGNWLERLHPGRVKRQTVEGWGAFSERHLAEKLNFLLLTYDSCRYDVLVDATTTNLDSYAPIYRARTPGSYTYAAHQSFFSGVFPNVEEGEALPYYNRFNKQLLALNGQGETPLRKDCLRSVVSDVNLIDGLRAEGYQTIGAGAMGWFKQQTLQIGFESFRYTGTDAEAQVDFLRAELDGRRPFFGFINFGETHEPYTYKGKQGKCPVRVQARLMDFPPVEKGAVGKDCPAYAHQLEAAEFLDRQLPRLFEELPGNTVVVLCGDHGECMGEDGFWGHGVSHPKALEVPLSIFRLDRQPLS